MPTEHLNEYDAPAAHRAEEVKTFLAHVRVTMQRLRVDARFMRAALGGVEAEEAAFVTGYDRGQLDGAGKAESEAEKEHLAETRRAALRGWRDSQKPEAQV